MGGGGVGDLGFGGFGTTPGGVAAGGGIVAGGGVVAGDESLFSRATTPAPAAASFGAELRSRAEAVSTPAIVQMASRAIETQRCVFIDQLLVHLE